MITYRSEPATDVVEICAEGRIDDSDLAYAFQRLDNDIARCGEVRVLEIIDGVEGVEPKALVTDILHAPKVLPHVARAAVVTDEGWVAALTRLAAPILGKAGEIKTFRKAELDQARAWIASA